MLKRRISTREPLATGDDFSNEWSPQVAVRESWRSLSDSHIRIIAPMLTHLALLFQKTIYTVSIYYTKWCKWRLVKRKVHSIIIWLSLFVVSYADLLFDMVANENRIFEYVNDIFHHSLWYFNGWFGYDPLYIVSLGTIIDKANLTNSKKSKQKKSKSKPKLKHHLQIRLVSIKRKANRRRNEHRKIACCR